MLQELVIQVLMVTDVDGGLGELGLAHNLEHQPGHGVGLLHAELIHTADGDVGEQGARCCAVIALDGNELLVLPGL